MTARSTWSACGVLLVLAAGCRCGVGEEAPTAATLGVLQGHGEPAAASVCAWWSAWRCVDVDLHADGPARVPAGEVLALVHPTAPLTPEEDAAVLSWVEGGGHVLVALEPDAVVPDFMESLGVRRVTAAQAGPAGRKVPLAPDALPELREPVPLAFSPRDARVAGVWAVQDGVAVVVAGAAPGGGRWVVVGDAEWLGDPDAEDLRALVHRYLLTGSPPG